MGFESKRRRPGRSRSGAWRRSRAQRWDFRGPAPVRDARSIRSR